MPDPLFAGSATLLVRLPASTTFRLMQSRLGSVLQLKTTTPLRSSIG